MRLLIDTKDISFSLAQEPRPVVDFETKQPKIVDGSALSTLNLLATTSEDMTIISVKVSGLVGGLKVGEPVRVSGLVANPWNNNGKVAVSYKADGIESLAKAKAA